VSMSVQAAAALVSIIQHSLLFPWGQNSSFLSSHYHRHVDRDGRTLVMPWKVFRVIGIPWKSPELHPRSSPPFPSGGQEGRYMLRCILPTLL
jgi:hypothetical protein